MHYWLRAHPPIMLGKQGETVTKAGLLPLRRTDGDSEVYVMRPPPKKPTLGDAPWQIAKGTRRFCLHGQWQDCGETLPTDYDALEPLPVTALREAEEEISLHHTTIDRWVFVGDVRFRSASSGAEKTMALYVAVLHGSLEERENARWLSLSEVSTHARKDHAAIITAALARLDSLTPPLFPVYTAPVDAV